MERAVLGSSLAALVAVAMDPGRAEAEIRFDASDVHTESTLSFTVASRADRYLALQVCLYDGADRVTAATYAGRAFTLLGTTRVSPTAGGRIELWGLVAPPAGTANVVIETASPAQLWGVISYSGVHQTSPTRPFVAGTGTGTNPSFTAASVAGDTVVSALCLTGAADLVLRAHAPEQTTRGTLYTEDYAGGQVELPGAAMVSPGWRFTSSVTPRWAVAIVSLRPAAATGQAPDAGPDAGADVAADSGAADLAAQEPRPADLAVPEPRDLAALEAATEPLPPADVAGTGPDAGDAGGGPLARPVDLSIGCACVSGGPARPTGGGLTIVLLLAAGLRIASRPR
jgi:hypothetical protein